MNLLLKFLRLPAAEQRLVVSTTLLLGAIRLGLWLIPFRNLRGVLTRLTQVPARAHGSDQLSADQLVWTVTVASRYVPKATCLTQALVAQVLLARHGHPPSRLRIGVARGEEGQLEGHAWLESQGKVIIGGSELERYTPLPPLGERT